MKGANKTRLRHICLVGFSGSGKSCAGKIVAKKLRMPFEDIDEIVEDVHGATIAEIFLTKGEKYFRTEEKQAIRSIVNLSGRKSVIAIGGGGFEDDSTRQLLLRETTVIYLKCSLSEILKRMAHENNRPLLNLPATIRRDSVRSLLAKRRTHYEMAHITVTTSGKTIPEVAREICRRYKAYDSSHL